MPAWVRCFLPFAHLAFSRDLLVITIRGIPGDFAGPQRDSYDGVRVADHQQGEEVDQHRHANVVPATGRRGGVILRNNRDGRGWTAAFLSICH